jgi:uncharacterized membrane protein (GlpM family)
MPPENLFWFALAIKMAMTALFVIFATVAAERSGPLVGGLVATLPVSAGPAYVFLALEHEPAFIAESALASLALNAATTIYAAAYVLLAQRHRFAIAVPGAVIVWLAAVAFVAAVKWTTLTAFLFNVVVFPICLLIVARFRHVPAPPTKLRWYDIAARALLVAFLVGSVVLLSFRIGPELTGFIAVFPVVFTSIMFILHRRIGGRAAAAVLANAILGLAGFGAAVMALHLAAVPLGSPAALSLALAVSIVWNVVVYAMRSEARA